MQPIVDCNIRQKKRVNHVEAQYILQCIRELDTAARCMNDLGVLSATPGYKRSYS